MEINLSLTTMDLIVLLSDGKYSRVKKVVYRTFWLFFLWIMWTSLGTFIGGFIWSRKWDKTVSVFLLDCDKNVWGFSSINLNCLLSDMLNSYLPMLFLHVHIINYASNAKYSKKYIFHILFRSRQVFLKNKQNVSLH